MNNAANFLGDDGRFDAAIESASEAVSIYRDLAAGDPGLSLEFAKALRNLATALNVSGDRFEALAPAREAVRILRSITGDSQARSDLAGALSSLSIFLAETGDDRGGLEAAEEAVGLAREPGGQQPVLAEAMTTLANRLSDVGRLDGALAAAGEARDSAEAVRSLGEAVRIHRDLAAGNDGFRPDLAASLDNLASALAEAGRTEDALVPALEAVAIYRRLVAARRALAPDLSGALHNLANRLEDSGRARDALGASVEILGLEGRTDATAAAIHRLLEVPPEDRPEGADDLSADAIDRVGDLIPSPPVVTGRLL